MLNLYPNTPRENGKNKFVVLPYREFQAMQELLDDIEDIALIEDARRNGDGGPGLAIEEVRQQLGLDGPKDSRQPSVPVQNGWRRSARRGTVKFVWE